MRARFASSGSLRVYTSTALPGQIVRFAAFELDRRSGELRKRGIKIELQDQPLQILILLLNRPGDTVTRAEIRDKLWPADTFVDFENAISAGVRKVREALRDNPDSPRFIETVARHGYRFVCPVYKDDGLFVTGSPIEQVPPILISGNGHEGSQIDIQEVVVGSPRSSDLAARGLMTRAACGFAVLLAFLTAFWAGRRSGSPTDENLLSNATFSRFTDFPGDETDASISPDGKFVAFRADKDGRSDVWVSQVGTGRFVNLTKDQPEDPLLPIRNLGFSADASQIWLAGYRPNQRLRLIPLMGGAPRPFLRDHTENVTWSP